MNYVPGYRHDIFISYAHLDNRGWVERFLDHLKRQITTRLGYEPIFWLDDETLRRDRDFKKEIPESVGASALFMMLASPSYINSEYCVGKECPAFRNSIAARRERFQTKEFENSQFALSCPILAVENNEHRTLFDGLTDISFCDEEDTFAIGSAKFTDSLSKLVGESVRLLRAMRHHSTPVFLYPVTPTPDIERAHQQLRNELAGEGFRILPDRQTNLEGQLRDASLSVFLLGGMYDDKTRALAELANDLQNHWIVWRSPESVEEGEPKQLAFVEELQQNDPTYMTFLPPHTPPVKLKEQVFASLRPEARLPKPSEKPKIYLIFNLKHVPDKKNAGSILLHYDKEFQFEMPDNPALRGSRLTKSDGVLLIWGTADTEWCLSEFQAMLQTAKSRNRGLCVFDPKETKQSVIQEIRESAADFHIAEEFGKFDPAKLETFFEAIRQGKLGDQSKGAASVGD